MTGPLLAVLLLALLSVGLIAAGIYLLAGLGAALIFLGVSTLCAAVITARGAFSE